MEYDPSTQQLTVRGPVDTRLVLNALGVSYASSSKVANPDYIFMLHRSEFGPVIQALDQAYIADTYGQEDHTDRRILSDALFRIIATDALEHPLP